MVTRCPPRSRGLFVTARALVGRGRLYVLPQLNDLGVTGRASTVKGLHVVHNEQGGACFEFNLRYLWQEFGCFTRSGMTTPACGNPSGRWVLGEKVCGQRCRSVRRPRGFKGRMFRQLACRLGCVMTLNTGDRRSSVDVSITRIVFLMFKGHRTQLCVFAEHDHIRYGLFLLRPSLSKDRIPKVVLQSQPQNGYQEDHQYRSFHLLPPEKPHLWAKKVLTENCRDSVYTRISHVRRYKCLSHPLMTMTTKGGGDQYFSWMLFIPRRMIFWRRAKRLGFFFGLKTFSGLGIIAARYAASDAFRSEADFLKYVRAAASAP